MKIDLEKIKTSVRKGNYRYSEHAVTQMILRGIDTTEVETALLTAPKHQEWL